MLQVQGQKSKPEVEGWRIKASKGLEMPCPGSEADAYSVSVCFHIDPLFAFPKGPWKPVFPPLFYRRRNQAHRGELTDGYYDKKK